MLGYILSLYLITWVMFSCTADATRMLPPTSRLEYAQKTLRRSLCQWLTATRFVHGVTSDLFGLGEDASQKKKMKVIHIRIKAMHKECDWSVLRAGWITIWCASKPHARWRPTKSTSTIWTHSIENENSFPSLQIVSVEQSFSKSKSFPGYSRNSPH